MQTLFDRTQSFLAVIDVQVPFLEKLDTATRLGLVERITWVTRLAAALEVPVLAMGETMNTNGPLHPEVQAALPPGTKVHDKRVFGMAGQADILAAARAMGRPQAVLIGMETDVCVAQSALGLRDAGFAVAVIADATGSPGSAHADGLMRLRFAGITVMEIKALFYDWVHDVATSDSLPELTNRLPGGLSL